MQFLNNMYQGAQDYWKQIPQNTSRQMAYSFATAFVLRSVMRNDPRSGIIAGVLSATACAIYGLVTPLFQKVCQHNPLSWSEEMCRTFTAIIPSGYIAAALGDRSIIDSLFVLSIIYGLITYIQPERCNIKSAHWITIYPEYLTTTI